MTPTIEEYAALLRIDNIKKKNETSCIPWFSLRDLVLNHPDLLKTVNLFALAIYGLIIFPKNLRAEDVTWRAPWIRHSVLLYKVGNQDWVPLLGLWGGVGYAPLMVQRLYEKGPRHGKVLEENSSDGIGSIC
ncbi:hypothetical protein CXB51_027354 [Gossypium anomalum]|uniref:Uncharacterized protein n=1 Tax=Gossypium anomalum TaxID=47600 RepID=A0A8J6CPA3_9ROSI|nr:hypothetical protein CXB51_027354 [Gossypium anomalum]